MTSMTKRLIVVAAATILPVTLLTGPIASPAQATPLSPTDTYTQKVKGLSRLQAPGASPNAFSLTVGPAVGWNAGLEGLRPPAAPLYRLWDMKVAWKDVNPAQGVFEWSELDRRVALVESWGGKPLLVLGLTPQWAAANPAAGDPRWGAGTASPPSDRQYWDTYVTAVANRYGSRIGGYELWNEANLPTFWQGTTEQLYELAESASTIIRAASTEAIVLAPSTTTRLRNAARKFTAGFASQIPKGTKGPFDAWTIHSYPTGSAGVNFNDGTKTPRAAADKRVDDILNWQNALVDAVGPNSPALDIDIYDTEVNYGLRGPGIEPGQNWNAAEATQLMNMTYQDSRNLGINSTFWYQYTSTPYDLLGVQWNPSQPGLDAMWNTMRTAGIPPIAGASLLSAEDNYGIPNFKNCFIRPNSDCSGQTLKGIDLSGAMIRNMDFSNAFLGDANLSHTVLTNVDFTNAYLGRANFRSADIENWDITSRTRFLARSFYKANFTNVKIRGVTARGANFYGTRWNNARLRSVDFLGSNFKGADFSKSVWVYQNDMRGTELWNSRWDRASIHFIKFNDRKNVVDFAGAKKCPQSLKNNKSKGFKNKCTGNVDLSPSRAGCAVGGGTAKSCVIGNTGPGGGIVFYVNESNATGSRYLEAAANTWNGGTADPSLEWSGNTETSVSTQTGIGTGSANTAAIIADSNTANRAATAAFAYRGGGLSDWFLPSKDELNQLYAQKDVVGGFTVSHYWSSSQSSAMSAWNQYFDGGGLGNNVKYNPNPLRPVRTF